MTDYTEIFYEKGYHTMNVYELSLYIPQFKGLKGRRTVTYRNSLYSDDLDDPELVFDNNNSFGDECIIRSSLCNKKEGRSASTTYAAK